MSDPKVSPIDASEMPDVSRLVREVAQSGRPRLLQMNGFAALLSPVRPRRTSKRQGFTDAQWDAVMSAVGGWEGLVDAEQLKRDLDAARSDRDPPVEL